MNVRSLIEVEMAAALSSSNVIDCPALPGSADGVRPDRYVSVVATEAEHRGCAHLVTLEFRVVAPAADPIDSMRETSDAVYLWATGEDSPLKEYEANGLEVFGHSPANLKSEVRDFQRAEILEFKVGAKA
jgi:hypothetical protein